MLFAPEKFPTVGRFSEKVREEAPKMEGIQK